MYRKWQIALFFAFYSRVHGFLDGGCCMGRRPTVLSSLCRCGTVAGQSVGASSPRGTFSFRHHAFCDVKWPSQNRKSYSDQSLSAFRYCLWRIVLLRKAECLSQIRKKVSIGSLACACSPVLQCRQGSTYTRTRTLSGTSVALPKLPHKVRLPL